MSMDQYLVTVDFPNDFKMFTKKQAYGRMFGEAFAMDADADFDYDNITTNKNRITFLLTQQTVDDPNGDFTEENIIKVLEFVKSDRDINFSFSIEKK